MVAATVTTTAAVAYTANIGDTRRPRWPTGRERPQRSIRLPQASQGPPTGESPHGSFLGRTMSISIRRESRVIQPNSLRDLKGAPP